MTVMMDDGFICVFCTAPSLAIFTISPASLSAAAETLSLSLYSVSVCVDPGFTRAVLISSSWLRRLVTTWYQLPTARVGDRTFNSLVFTLQLLGRHLINSACQWAGGCGLCDDVGGLTSCQSLHIISLSCHSFTVEQNRRTPREETGTVRSAHWSRYIHPSSAQVPVLKFELGRLLAATL